MPTYQSTNLLNRANTLRSIPMYRTAAAVFGAAWQNGKVVPRASVVSAHVTPTAPIIPARELANAEARLQESIRLYENARREIGVANRPYIAALVIGGRVAVPQIPLSPERVRARKSAAFSMFNKRRAELRADRRRVEALRATVGAPSLAEIEEREAIAIVIRAGKRRVRAS